jgi:hypothetical protein
MCKEKAPVDTPAPSVSKTCYEYLLGAGD